MVEGTGLENRRTGNGIESSNLSLSVRNALRAAYFVLQHAALFLDGWLSGLRRTPGKCVYVKAYRGFESHPIRKRSLSPLHLTSAAGYRASLQGICGER